MAQLAILAAGMGLQAYSTLEEGKQAAELGKISQAQYDAEARATKDAGNYASREQRKEGQRLMATQMAQAGAQGGSLSGSNLTIMANSAKEMEMDAMVISRNYTLEANKLTQQGAMARYQGQLARRNSRIRALADGLTTAGTAALIMGLGSTTGGAAKVGGSGAKMGTTATPMKGVSAGRYGMQW